MSTPAIMEALRRKRDQIAGKQREVEILEAEVRGMEEVLALIPQVAPARPQQSESAQSASGSMTLGSKIIGARVHAGRQPGAISNRWKRNLLALNEKDIFSLEEVTDLVEERENRSMKPSEVKRLFDKYVEQGHLQSAGTNMYVVPETVVARFRIALRDEPDDGAENNNDDDISEDNEVPTVVGSKPNYDLDDDIPF